jgi:2'-5' RNA ligase
VAPSVAWVAPDNLHLTVKFLGGVEPGQVEAVTAALRATVSATPPFELAIAGLGAFPTASRPRVIWAGVSGGREPVCRLAGEVEAALEPLGFAPESRPFSPHLTLGRIREPRPDRRLAALIARGAGRAFGDLRVTSVSLMRSVLGPGGPRYSELAAVALGPDPAVARCGH